MTEGDLDRVGIFGLGEAGSLIAADLVSAEVHVIGFDPADVPTPSGVIRADSATEAVKRVDLIMAITAASDAQTAIAQAWADLPRGAVYADLSTAPPSFKQDLNDTATLRGLGFVDVALMATVPGRGLSTPSYASGSGAEAYARFVNTIGGNVEVVGQDPGDAATRKLLRSVITKGLASLAIEALAADSALDLEEWLWEHIVETLETMDRQTIERLVAGSWPHVERRIVEMDSAASLLESAGVDPLLTRATESTFIRVKEGTLSRTISDPMEKSR